MINHIALIGVGLIGGSLARALRRQGLADKITGFVSSDETARKALEQGVVDDIATSPGEAVADADIVVLATPMKAMKGLLPDIAASMPASCILTDVGSVKQSLIDEVAAFDSALLPRLVPAHPIAGTEASGVDASFAELFTGRDVVLTPTEQTQREHVEKVMAMWSSIGSRVLTMSAREHDAIFARTSHLPHLVAYALVDYMAQETDSDRLFELAAGGFYDFTRIASSDPVMWRDICLTNREAILESLKGYIDALESLQDRVEKSDAEGIRSVFDSARQARNQGLENKRKQ